MKMSKINGLSLQRIKKVVLPKNDEKCFTDCANGGGDKFMRVVRMCNFYQAAVPLLNGFKCS